MYFYQKHKTHHKHSLGKIFAYLALITGMSHAAFWTIFPLVVENILKSDAQVGLFFSFVSVAVLVGSLFSTIIFTKFSRLKITKTVLLVGTILLLLLTLVNSLLPLLIIELSRATTALFMGIILSLYVRDTAKKLGDAEGRYFLFSNLGWLLGPLAGGFLAAQISRNAVFIFSAILYFITFLVFQIEHPLIKHTTEKKKSLSRLYLNLKQFFAYRELRKVYLTGFGTSFWYAVNSIYFPLYIIQNGFTESTVGLVLSAAILPLVLLERPIAKLTDKKPLRLFMAAGFLILAIIMLFFTIIPYVAVVLIFMSFANLGLAFIEPLTEIYLFKTINKEDEERFYGVYNTSFPLASILAPLFLSLCIFLLGFKGVWYGAALILGLLSLVAFSIKK